MPEGMAMTRFEAHRGEIWIPSLSILVARLDKPVLLRRREDATPELGPYDLHAAYSYFNRALWADQEFEKTITLYAAKKPITVTMFELTSSVLMDGAIRIEGVTFQWQQRQA